jgi:hypothetical protein
MAEWESWLTSEIRCGNTRAGNTQNGDEPAFQERENPSIFLRHRAVFFDFSDELLYSASYVRVPCTL